MVLGSQSESLHPEQRSGVTVPQSMSPTSTSEDLVAAVFGLLVVAAVYFDGRAHVLDLADSFFTPWHAALYGGLLLLIAWLAVISRRAATRYGHHRLGVIPAGYGLAISGAALFAVGGVVDMIWHQIFGVEFGIDALLSPAHLVLFVGGVLLLSGPIRAFRLRTIPLSLLTRLPPTLAVLGITAIAAFSLSFLSGFVTDSATFAVLRAPEGTDAHIMSESIAATGLASYVITSLVVVVPLSYLIRVRLAALGTAILLVTSVALLASVLMNFQEMGTVIAALVAGALVDVVLRALRRLDASLRAQELVLATLLPLLLWSGQILVTDMEQGVLWSVEMVTGAVILSALASLATVFSLGPVSASHS